MKDKRMGLWRLSLWVFLVALIVGHTTNRAEGDDYYKTKEEAEAAKAQCEAQVKSFQQQAVARQDYYDATTKEYEEKKSQMTAAAKTEFEKRMGWSAGKYSDAHTAYNESFTSYATGLSAFNNGFWTTAYNEFKHAYGRALTACLLVAESVKHIDEARLYLPKAPDPGGPGGGD